MGFLIMPALREPNVCETPCAHRDCVDTRRMAALPCVYCGKPVEAGRPYYVEEIADGKVTRLSHARCALEHAEMEGRDATGRGGD